MELLRPHITKNLIDVDEATLIGMLKGNVPLVEDFPVDIEITHAHFVYFSPSVRVKFIFLPHPTSLSHRNTHMHTVA